MHGLMMDQPLLISDLIRHADRHHGSIEIVSKTVEGGVHRYTYRDAHRRARQLANALKKLGVRMHDRVATLAWNGFRHYEIYYAVAGAGAVIHTINPRLFPDQVAYIANHAEDKIVFYDTTFAPLVEKLRPQLKTVQRFIPLTDEYE
jgi:3-(methylthio)propionyl---CoA ligase